MSSLPKMLAVAALVLLRVPAPAQEHPRTPALCLDALVAMDRCQLKQLYRHAGPAPALDGYFAGRSARRPRVTGLLWKGKLFCGAHGAIVNRWCLGVQAIRADVYPGESWLDGGPALIMDYRASSRVWHDVRDELREVAPGLFLGIMYRERKAGPRFVTFFALEATPHCN